jgi:pilus assembly protein CpaF
MEVSSLYDTAGIMPACDPCEVISDGRALAEDIRTEITQELDSSRVVSDEELMDIITEAVFHRSECAHMNIKERRELADLVFNSMRRLDILQPVIDDKTITEIMINGPDKLFIERGGRINRLKRAFDSHERLEDVIHNIVSRTNRTVNEASP